MDTPIAAFGQNDIPRPEYPRPQFVRERWMNLNGGWQFEIDHGDSGAERGLRTRELSGTITVPFCPESKLSGIEHVDFMLAVWYRKTMTIPAEWAQDRVLLHFGACDYDTTVWVNDVEVVRHRGGFTSFSADLSGVAKAGEPITIVVRARDDWRGPKPRGKQSGGYANGGCHYHRTTGIWQTVWLEPVPRLSLKRPRITPDVAGSRFRITTPLLGNPRGCQVRATLLTGTTQIAQHTVPADRDFAPTLDLVIPSDRVRLWSIDAPFLYDLKLELLDSAGALVDSVTSYAGLRSVTIDGMAIKLNGKPVFQRLVLDQGFYPDGILTAPTDAALQRDIEISMQAGFNGARLHQKVFEERFLYHADRMGYLVWGEFADWGCRQGGGLDDIQQPPASYITQWLEAIERDYSHPSIIGWCPLNETLQNLSDRITVLDDVTRGMFLATKALDPTRPVLDASGYSHRVPETDVWDCHDYEQDPQKLAANQAGLAEGKPFTNGAKPGQPTVWSIPYGGQPFFVSEFGGAWWNPDAKPGEPSWGYGDRPKTVEEFYTRFEALCTVLLQDKNMFGYCYTQLTDVFQEQNGVVKFDRSMKLDLSRLAKAQTQRAAVEEQ